MFFSFRQFYTKIEMLYCAFLSVRGVFYIYLTKKSTL